MYTLMHASRARSESSHRLSSLTIEDTPLSAVLIYAVDSTPPPLTVSLWRRRLWVSHCDGEAGVVYFEVMCVHEGSRGDAGQAAAVCMHVRSCLYCAHCLSTHAGQAGLRMVFIAGSTAWSGSTIPTLYHTHVQPCKLLIR